MKYIDFDLLGDMMLIVLTIGTSIYFMGVSKVIGYLGGIAVVIKLIGMKYKSAEIGTREKNAN